MKKLVLVVALLLVCGVAYPMAWEIKSPPKGITLVSKTGMSYSLYESVKRPTTGLEICDFYGLSLNGMIGFSLEGNDNPRYIINIDYNFKQFPELAENLPPLKPIAYVVDLANKIPFVELSGGVGFGCDGKFEKKGVELTASVVKVTW